MSFTSSGNMARGTQARRLAAVAALAFGVAASAQVTTAPERPPGEIGSERTMGVEVKLGAFTPLIDREVSLGAVKPYETIYGGDPMLLFNVSAERQLFQALGTAGVGLSGGYAEKYAPALLEDDSQAGESTGLRLVPLQLFGVYRFDYPAHAWGVPLVPYVKAGLSCTVWSASKGADLETTRNGKQAIGARWGWGFTGGLSLLLDVFEPRLARDFDTDMGVNHSYLFVEFNFTDVNNFYTAGLDLSGRYVMFGAAFEI